jgi:hypothetical protein
MAQGEKIGSGHVDIEADMTQFDNAMNALPRRASSKMDAAMKSLQAQMARTKLDLKLAVNQAALTGNTAPMVALTGLQDRLKDKIDAVTAAATRQAQALQDAARAAVASSVVPQGPKDPFAVAIDKLQQVGRAGAAAGQQIRQGGMSGAMGLMVLSQTIDDMQYGFHAVVNQIPMLGMGLGSILGMSSQAAMKFGAIAGIAAVAINTIINHWDQLLGVFGASPEILKLTWEGIFGEAKHKAITAIDAIEARIKELEDKPHRVAIEVIELDAKKQQRKEMKEGIQAFEQLGRAQSPFEKQSGEKVAALFSGMDARAADSLKAKMKEAIAGELEKTSATVQAADTKKAEAEATVAAITKAMMREGNSAEDMMALGQQMAKAEAEAEAAVKAAQDIRAEIRKTGGEAEAELGKIFHKATKGNGDAQAELARRLRASGAHGLANQVEALSPAAAADAAKEKLDRDAKDRRDKETDALNKQGAENERDMLEQRAAERSQEAARFAGALQPRLSGEILKPGGISGEDLQAKVKQALEKAGVAAHDIGKLVDETARKLRRDVEERIREKQIGGLSLEQARGAVLREDKAKKEGLNAGQPKVQSTEDYLRQFLVAGGKPSDDIRGLSEAQLTEQKNMTELLKEINENLAKKEASRAATFGSKRS